MPPEASSWPEIGLNFSDTSTSLYGPGGATMTLNWFLVERCTSTFLPLGAPAMSSTAHWPSTVVQPSMPLVSKSKRSTGMLSGNLTTAGAARAASLPLVQLLGHRLPLGALDERHVGQGMAILQRRHHAHHPIPLVFLH